MRTAGDIIGSKLKSKDIKKRKPFLKLCSNHFREEGPKTYRFWHSFSQGTARSDGKGWFVPVDINFKPKKPRPQKPQNNLKRQAGFISPRLIAIMAIVLVAGFIVFAITCGSERAKNSDWTKRTKEWSETTRPSLVAEDKK